MQSILNMRLLPDRYGLIPRGCLRPPVQMHRVYAV